MRNLCAGIKEVYMAVRETTNNAQRLHTILSLSHASAHRRMYIDVDSAPLVHASIYAAATQCTLTHTDIGSLSCLYTRKISNLSRARERERVCCSRGAAVECLRITSCRPERLSVARACSARNQLTDGAAHQCQLTLNERLERAAERRKRAAEIASLVIMYARDKVYTVDIYKYYVRSAYCKYCST